MHTSDLTIDDKFRKIGAGNCGSVWAKELHSEPSAFKREDGHPGRSLSNDFAMHKRVLEALQPQIHQDQESVQVPRCHHYMEAEHDWWTENIRNFPQDYRPCNILESERIPPLPHHIREFLIEKYCPTKAIEHVKSSDSNQDCLVRPYLGRRRIGFKHNDRPARLQSFSLRNFPLHLDQMEELEFPTEQIELYANTMADALAGMHWRANIDANDVEFVLAPPRMGQQATYSNTLGEHSMWILDFDCCRDMPMSLRGVEKAVIAFYKNDPFFPRPGQPLWQAFRNRYLQTSERILSQKEDEECSGLSNLFIEKVEKGRPTNLFS